MSKYTSDDLEDAQVEIDNLNDVIDDLENLETDLGEKAVGTAKWCKSKAAYYHRVAEFISSELKMAKGELEEATERFDEINDALPDSDDEHRLSHQQMGL